LEGTEVAGPVNATSTSMRRKNQVEAQASLISGAASYVAGEVVKKGTAKLFSAMDGSIDQGIEYASDYVSQTISGKGDMQTITGKPIGVVSNDSKGDGNVEIIPSIYGSMQFSDTRHVLASGNALFPATTNSIYDYMKVPSLLYIGTIGTDPFQFEINPFYNDRTSFQCSRIRMIGNMFRRWRGGVQYTILFPSSNFISFRVNVGLNYNSDPSFSAGDVPMKVVSVHGTTKVSLFVPYLYPNLWMGTGATERMGTITISVPSGQAPRTVGDVTPTCPFMIYEAPGNDFQFSSLREFGPTYVASEVEAQSSVMELCAMTPFAGSHPGSFQNVDEVDSFEGIMSRWSARIGGSLTPVPLPLVTAAQQNGGSLFDQLARVFLFWRGQIKFKQMFSGFAADTVNVAVLARFAGNQISESIYGIQDQYRFVDGIRVISLNDTQVLDYVVPFVCNTEWMPYYPAAPYVTSSRIPTVFNVTTAAFSNSDPTPAILVAAIAAGRDFVMKYSVPPPSTYHRWWD